MKTGVLTSSRADYGVYTPLLKALHADPFFDLEIIAFGTHLSEKYGSTLNEIEEGGFEVIHKVDTMPDGDNPEDISAAMGKTMINFSEFWKANQYDLIFALGDRYEMFAAVAAGLPFNIRVAHLHGGETTTGAIDNALRHSITHMSHIHFASAEVYKEKIISLTGKKDDIYNVGALSFDNLYNLPLLSMEDFKNKFGVDMHFPTILITFHPETIEFDKNEVYIDELVSALEELKKFQLLITMPNADTTGNMIRKKLNSFIERNDNAAGFENLGTVGYLSAIKHCVLMLGNTSSGCTEASFFPKWVINLGDRQHGRIVTPNMINCRIDKSEIIKKVNEVYGKVLPQRINIFGNGNTANSIISVLRENYGG